MVSIDNLFTDGRDEACALSTTRERERERWDHSSLKREMPTSVLMTSPIHPFFSPSTFHLWQCSRRRKFLNTRTQEVPSISRVSPQHRWKQSTGSRPLPPHPCSASRPTPSSPSRYHMHNDSTFLFFYLFSNLMDVHGTAIPRLRFAALFLAAGHSIFSTSQHASSSWRQQINAFISYRNIWWFYSEP